MEHTCFSSQLVRSCLVKFSNDLIDQNAVLYIHFKGSQSIDRKCDCFQHGFQGLYVVISRDGKIENRINPLSDNQMFVLVLGCQSVPFKISKVTDNLRINEADSLIKLDFKYFNF